jgi:class 3 adenylate cyclase
MLNYCPRVLIAELNDLFTAFDRVAAQNGCERIKTIGDAYLCVCGMPAPDKQHALNMVRTARGMLAFLRRRNSTARYKWEVRIGIHSGPVVGGIVGTTKYI